MSWIYVTEPGAKLNRQGGRYVISRANETICEVPSAIVEGVTLFDLIQITSSAVVDLLERNIPLTWLSSTSCYFGRLESTDHQNVLRQKEQFDALADKDFCLALAKRVVFGKIYNQRTILRNYNRRAEDPFIEKVRSNIRILADKLHMAHSVEEVMGYEGRGRKHPRQPVSMVP